MLFGCAVGRGILKESGQSVLPEQPEWWIIFVVLDREIARCLMRRRSYG